MIRNARGRAARASLSCLFAALCAAGAFVALPIPGSPVPIVAQNLFVVLAGLLLGPLWGSAAVLAFLCLGALGFPVFSGGRGGLALFAGPTGGYLVGYALAAFASGLVARKRGIARSALGAVLGFALILALGVLRLKLLKEVEWGEALALGLLPFLPGDAVKAILATLVAAKLGPFADSLTGRGSHGRA
ncbi:MAG TPA: biotin transporter BioY [Spirochaetales bacterium]|nr:biotin transporter BioY [Spirochaetales bacterium]